MPLTGADRVLLTHCLRHEPGAWNDFIDRYLGLIDHVVQSTAHLRGMTLRPQDVEDLVAEILAQIVAKDYAVLRRFRGRSSLAAYLTVIARRICVHALAEHAAVRQVQRPAPPRLAETTEDRRPPAGDGLALFEQVQQLLGKLPPRERQVVRLFYLEGKSYEEISQDLGIPVNTVGSILTRARGKLRGEEEDNGN